MPTRVHVVTSIAAGAGVVAALTMTVALGSDHGTSGKAEATRLVSYHGYRAQVPESWPVYDLSKDPSRCVRFDRHAVYLGTPGPDQHCPAHIVGRTEALLVQPLTPGNAGSEGAGQAGELRKNLPDARVAVTASYLKDRSLASSLVNPAPGQAGTAPGAVAPTASGTAAATPPASPASPGPSASPGTGTPGSSGSAAPSTDPAPPTTAASSPPADPTSSATATDAPSGTAMSPTPSGESPTEPTESVGPSATASAAPSATGTPSATGGDLSGDSTAPGGSAPVPEGTGVPTQSSAPDQGNVVSPSSPAPTISRSPFTVPSALVTTGLGFDTCAAPSADTMQAWQSTALDSVGVYIGGENRACPDGNLSAAWTSTVRGYGYSFLPIYVGLQAPCNARTGLAKIDPARAGVQGAVAAGTAAAEMTRFGLGAGNVVYLDIEFYDPDASCTAAVLDFVAGWTRHLHALGYASGVYGNATAVARDMALAAPSGDHTLPDALWFARWNNTVDVDATPYVPDSLWVDRRAKQYQAPHNETHGGRLINIDGDYVQGVVALPGAF